jgi:hypothetical protein
LLAAIEGGDPGDVDELESLRVVEAADHLGRSICAFRRGGFIATTTVGRRLGGGSWMQGSSAS